MFSSFKVFEITPKLLRARSLVLSFDICASFFERLFCSSVIFSLQSAKELKGPSNKVIFEHICNANPCTICSSIDENVAPKRCLYKHKMPYGSLCSNAPLEYTTVNLALRHHHTYLFHTKNVYDLPRSYSI